MLDKNPETRIGVPDIKVGEPEVLGWAGFGYNKQASVSPSREPYTKIHRLYIGFGFGVCGLWVPSRQLLVECPWSFADWVSVYLTSPCPPNFTVAPLGDQEWEGAPSLGGRALQCGGGDGGGGEELSQAHPQLDHGGKGVRGRRLPCPGRA